MDFSHPEVLCYTRLNGRFQGYLPSCVGLHYSYMVCVCVFKEVMTKSIHKDGMMTRILVFTFYAIPTEINSIILNLQYMKI